MVKVGVWSRLREPVNAQPKGSKGSVTGLSIYSQLIHGVKERIYQPQKVYLSGGNSEEDSYSLSSIERRIMRGGIRRFKWSNGGIHDFTGCWPTCSCSTDLAWLHRACTGVDAWGNFPKITDGDVQQAVVKTYSKLDQLFVQSSVTAIESPQTLKMLRLIKLAKLIRSPAKTITNGLIDLTREVKRYRRRHGAATVAFGKKVSNVWLEYRMGLCPTLYEFDSYKELIVKGIAEYDSSILRVTGVYKKPVYRAQHVHGFSGYTDVYYNFGVTFWVTERTKIGCTIFYRDRNLSDAVKYQVALGLDAGSIPLHVWETVPLSFVVDRFLNVGQWLSAWKPKPGLTILDSITSKKRKMVSDRYDTTGPYGTYYREPIGDQWYYEYAQLVREKTPPLSSKPLLNTQALELKQHLDHVALLAQKIPNLLKKRARR